MQRLINEIVERAKADRQRIVLPEGTEERTLKAANQILTDGVADLILLGNPDEINACATEWGLGNISKATIIDQFLTPDIRKRNDSLCRSPQQPALNPAKPVKLLSAVFCIVYKNLHLLGYRFRKLKLQIAGPDARCKIQPGHVLRCLVRIPVCRSAGRIFRD